MPLGRMCGDLDNSLPSASPNNDNVFPERPGEGWAGVGGWAVVQVQLAGQRRWVQNPAV